MFESLVTFCVGRTNTVRLARVRNSRQSRSVLSHESKSSDGGSAGANSSTCGRNVEVIAEQKKNGSKRNGSNRARTRNGKLEATNGGGMQLSCSRINCPAEYRSQLVLNSHLLRKVRGNMRAEAENFRRKHISATKGKRVENAEIPLELRLNAPGGQYWLSANLGAQVMSTSSSFCICNCFFLQRQLFLSVALGARAGSG